MMKRWHSHQVKNQILVIGEDQGIDNTFIRLGDYNAKGAIFGKRNLKNMDTYHFKEINYSMDIEMFGFVEFFLTKKNMQILLYLHTIM